MKKLLSLLLLTIFSSTLLLSCSERVSGRVLKEGKTYTAKYLKEFEDKTYGIGDLKDNYNQMYIQYEDYSEQYPNSIVIKILHGLDDNDKIVVDIIKQYKEKRILYGHKEGVKLMPKEKWDEMIKENEKYYN